MQNENEPTMANQPPQPQPGVPSPEQIPQTPSELDIDAQLESTLPPAASVPASQPTTYNTSELQTSAWQQPQASVAPAIGPQAKSNKKLFIWIGVGIALFLALAGGVAGYAWYQSPQKVINDAIVAAVTAKQASTDGTLAVTSGQNSAEVTYKTEGTRYTGKLEAAAKIKSDGKTVNLSGNLVYDEKSNTYFKMSGLTAIMDEYIQSSKEQIPADVMNIVKKIDNKWYVISTDDLKELSPEAEETRKCINNVLHETDKNDKLLKEVGEVYAKNQFIIVKESLGTKDGNVGYAITADTTKGKAFGDALKKTELYKKLEKCSNSPDTSSSSPSVSDTETTKQPRVELWTDQWSHQPKKLVIQSNDNGTKVVSETNIALNRPVTITTPSGATSIKELQKDIEKLMGTSSTTSPATTQSTANQT